ncbi:hypothetical protein PsorP6_002992 [Peronosclerospora sorghi]|uniref:Uncharacterized protein n=1 Tax=Peronosclerospora sorghi TaxID=230839 RepID=A0ACC0VMF1_9STRA|nr:hypothetical protein PsorP6_002992 [Peronosclerospora sorghi]
MQLRLWLGEQRGPVHLNSSHADHSLTLRGLKGCVRKELREKTPRARVETDRRAEHVLDVLRAIFADGGQHGTRPDETSGSTLLPSTIASQIGTSTPVLALGSPSRRVIALMLLRDGYSNVYTISLTNDKRSSGTDCGQPHVQTLALQLCKCSIDLQHASVHEAEPEVEYEPCGVFHLHSTFGTDMLQEEAPEPVIVSYDPAGARVPPLACVIDAGFLARGLEGGTKKKHLPDLFRRLCRTLDKLVAACGRESRNDQIPALVCLTLRKHWRNKEFLAHTDLNYHVQSLAPAKEDVTATRVYVFCCFKHPIEQVSKTKSGEASSLEREVALKMYVTLEEQLSARVAEREGQVMVIDSVETYTRTSLAHEQSAVDLPPMYAQASGVITRVRRFRNGMTLVLLAFGGTDCKQELQLLLKRESLGWSLGMCTKVARLLRKGVEMTAVGAMVRASRGHSMLQVEALSLAHSSALETYN